MANSSPGDPSQIGRSLREARERAGLTQAQAAQLLGVGSQTVSRWERGEHGVKAGDFRRAMDLYQIAATAEPERLDDIGSRGTDSDEWHPNPALRRAIPERAYQIAIEYCRRLVRAGLDREEVEALERVMIDSRYAKANRRAGRELSEEDWILLVDDAWDAIRETLAARGVRV